jgi:hypothetical protein
MEVGSSAGFIHEAWRGQPLAAAQPTSLSGRAVKREIP